jgi:hypothetical protein
MFGPELRRFNLCALHQPLVCVFARKTFFSLSFPKKNKLVHETNISKTVILNFQTCLCDPYISPTLFRTNRQEYGTSLYHSTNIYLFIHGLFNEAFNIPEYTTLNKTVIIK